MSAPASSSKPQTATFDPVGSGSPDSGSRWNAAFTVAPFLVLAVLLSAYWVSPDRAPTSARNDIHTYHAPNVALIARGLAEDGELPRWNPQDFGGISLVADPQAGVYNPVNWMLALSDSVRAFGWLIVVSAMFGAAGFLRYARSIGCSIPAAAVGAICFVSSGSVLYRLVALGHVVMAPFFLVPWLFLGFERIGRRPRLLPGVVTALGVAWLVVWMHPQLLLYTGVLLLAAAFAVIHRSERPGRTFAALIVVAAASVGLSAVHWLPFVANLDEAARWVTALRGGPLAAPETPALFASVAGSAGHPEDRVHVGIVAFALAVAGTIACARRDPQRRIARFHLAAVAAITLAGFGLAWFGEADGLFRHPSRVLILIAMPLAALVAFGVDTLRRRFPAGALAIAALSFAVVTLESGVAHRGHVRTAPEEKIGALPPGLRLPPDVGSDARLIEPLREVTGRGIPELAKRRHAIESLTGYNPLLGWRFWVYAHITSGESPVGYDPARTTVAVRREKPVLAALFAITHELIARPSARPPWLWRRVPKPLPRAYLAPAPVLAPALDGPDAVGAMVESLERLAAMDPRHQVMLHGDVEVRLAAAGVTSTTRLEPFREVAVMQRRPNRIVLSVANRAPAVLVLAEPHAPGWRAWDGEVEIPVHRANALFRAVVLAPGEHTIAFVYAPRSWEWGRAVSGLTLSLCVAALVFGGVRRWRGRDAALASLC